MSEQDNKLGSIAMLFAIAFGYVGIIAAYGWLVVRGMS